MKVNGERTPASGGRWVLAGWLLILAGPAAYALLFDVPLMRTTGAPAFALISAGAAAGVVGALRDRRVWVRASCVLESLVLAGAVYVFFVSTTLPTTSVVATLEVAPDFTLRDHTGEDVALGDALAQGPVLLVFYRGHW
ncbi:MAG: hypothetical protein ACE5HE_05750 [Phycisphaerae bacterium]